MARARPAACSEATVDRTRELDCHDMEKIRVAIVAPSLRILGGQAVQADRLLAGWRDDPQVEAWLVPTNPLPPGPFARLHRIKYVRTVMTQLMYWPQLVRALRRAHVVHAFSASYWSFLLAPVPALLVARAFGRPVILHYHSGEAPDHLRRSPIARRTIGAFDRLVVPSQFLVEVFAGYGLDAVPIANHVDLARFRFRRRDSLTPTVLSVRNLERIYNVACTLKAFALVQQRRPDARLTVAGGGSLERELQSLAASLGLRNVTFTGRVPQERIAEFYAAHDIYVQSPDIDNMPLSVLEAYASGIPVVATDVGGVPAILTDGEHGLLAPPDDHHALASRILHLLEHPADAARMADRAWARCHEFQWSRVSGAWLDEYRDAAA
jgi:glycosyltransferase involved in cell wall biosynthesis